MMNSCTMNMVGKVESTWNLLQISHILGWLRGTYVLYYVP